MSKKLHNGVEVELDGRTFKLVPTLKAAEQVSTTFNGFIGAYQALQAISLQVAQLLVRAGTMHNGHKDEAGDKISTVDLNEAVWRAGVASITPALTKFVAILEHGGKDPEESGDEPSGNAGSSSGNE